MGCDIHTHAEKRGDDGRWEMVDGLRPFDWRSYGMFGFLANVRNYSAIPPIADPRGIPEDVSDAVRIEWEEWGDDGHTPSWLSVVELLRFDYDRAVEDRRINVLLAANVISGAGLAEPGRGRMTTYRDFLGDAFFDDLERLRSQGAERVVFWFDN